MVNHFSIMLQRRLKEQEHGEEEEEEGEKGANKKKKKKKKKNGQGGDLRIHDLDDDLELSSDNSESSAGEGMRENTEMAETGSFFSQFYIHIFIFSICTLFSWLFLERSFETLQTEKVGQGARRRTVQRPRGRRRKKRAVMWRDMKTAMMETLKVWKWTTCLMRAGNPTLLWENGRETGCQYLLMCMFIALFAPVLLNPSP